MLENKLHYKITYNLFNKNTRIYKIERIFHEGHSVSNKKEWTRWQLNLTIFELKITGGLCMEGQISLERKTCGNYGGDSELCEVFCGCHTATIVPSNLFPFPNVSSFPAVLLQNFLLSLFPRRTKVLTVREKSRTFSHEKVRVQRQICKCEWRLGLSISAANYTAITPQILLHEYSANPRVIK